MGTRAVRLGIGLLLAVSVRGAAQPATPRSTPQPGDPQAAYRPALGPFPVESVSDLVLRDAAREKDLPIRLYFPRGRGPFPLILFSHGAGGSKDTYDPLVRSWAERGYVVLCPTHQDSAALAARDPAKPGVVPPGITATLGDPAAWEGRVRDLSFLIDSLPALQRKVPALQGQVDPQRIGVGGHSFGAFTAQLTGGVTVDLPGGLRGKSYADPRVRALLLLSAQGRGQQGLTERSWTSLNRPMMSVTGTRDRGAGGQGPEWKKHPFDYSPPGAKYHALIEGAGHFSFSGRAAQGPAGRRRTSPGPLVRPSLPGARADEPAIFGWVKSVSLLFWDAHLRDDPRAVAYLASDSLGRASGGRVRLYRK